jgi:SAM-dependent methyltransferase
MEDIFKYPGNELEIFSKAINWKKYLRAQLTPYLEGRVLEIGSGIGGSANILSASAISSCTMVEPDSDLFQILLAKKQKGHLPPNSTILQGTIDSLPGDDSFDTIIYIDVLEHIEKDKEELSKAANRLKTGGKLIILSPAFQSLYSPFDKSIGHYRRYDKKMLEEITPPSLEILKMKFLDSVGYFASLTNKLLLKQTVPTSNQINLWDKGMVPVSRIFDRIFFYSFGKSILAVWKKR